MKCIVDDKFLLMEVVSESPLEGMNAISVEVSQYFSNYHNDFTNTSKITFGRGAYSRLDEISELEFRNFIQEKQKEKQDEINNANGGPVNLYYGKLKPRTTMLL